MSTLRISDAPLLPDVDGTEKIPTGGRGDYAISVDQIKDHIFQDVGKELVGLGNVDNTSDLDKPVSTAQQAALNLKADKTYVDTNLDLKADKTNVYTRSETTLALSSKADLVGGVVPESQIPSSFNDVLEFTTPNLPIIGESGKIYVTTDTNKTWRWSGNKYVEISGWNPDSVSKTATLPAYYTKEAGVDQITGVADGAYYNVRSSSDDSYIDEYQNIGGVPTPTGKSYPSSAALNNIPHNNLKNRDASGAHPASSIDYADGNVDDALRNLESFSSRSNRTIQSFGAVSGQDCTQALLDAAAWSRTNKQPVYDFIGGNYKFSQQLDFSANGAGLVGVGPYVTTLTWQGAENTTPVVSDQGGKHSVFQLTNKTGTFKWGELVTGARGGKGIVRSFPWEPLQVQTTLGDFAPAEVVTGSKSSASGLIMGISALNFGASVQSVNIRGFNLVADFERTTDQFNNPTKWLQSCGIYINGARNHSKIGDLVVDGFEFGLYSRMNWMCEYTDTILTVNCKNGIIFDYETNNIKLGVLSVRRGGNAADVNEGVGVQFIGSYSFIASNPIDVEASYCRGIVVEACHGVGLYGGDIENNDKSVRKIIIKGYEGADFANDSKAWTRGINLFGMRVHNCLGIQLENGAKQVTIGGNAFSWTTTGTPTGAFAVTVASGHTHIKDICYLETNDIFGQNETLLPNIPFSMQSTTMLAKELNKYHSIEAEISTTDVDRIIPIGRFPTNVSVNRVEVIQDTDLTGTAIIDVGAGGTLLAIVNTFNFTPVATASTPFGYQNMPLVTTIVNRGASVAHVRLRSGSTLSAGKLKVKIYYSLLF